MGDELARALDRVLSLSGGDLESGKWFPAQLCRRGFKSLRS